MSFSEVNSTVTLSGDVSSAMSVLPSAAEVLQLIQVMGRSDAMKYVSKQQELFGRCLTGHYRSSSVSSGSSSGCGRSVGSGVGLRARSLSPRERLARVRGLPSWRSNRRTTDGLCYTDLFLDECVQAEGQRLGEWPSFGRLLATDLKVFSPLSVLRDEVTVDFDAQSGLAHVRRDKSGAYSFVDLAAAVAWQRGQKRGSFGAYVKASVGSDFLPLPAGFSSGVPVGGVESLAAASYVGSVDPAFSSECMSLSLELCGLILDGVESEAAVSRYADLLGKVVDLKARAPPGYAGFGPMWDHAESYRATVLDTESFQVVEFNFQAFGSEAEAVRDANLELLRVIEKGYVEEIFGHVVRYTARTKGFQFFSRNQVAAGFQLREAFRVSTSESLKFASHRLLPRA